MLWPEIALDDLKNLHIVFPNKNIKNCLQEKNYAGFVFFDIGSVLLDLDWDIFIEEVKLLLPPSAKSNPKEVIHILKKEGVLKKWSTGKIGSNDYANFFIEAIKKSLGVENSGLIFSINDIKKADSVIVGAARARIIELAKKLREKNFGIGVLSNATTWHEIMIEKRIPIRDLFDVCIFSQDIGCEKPEPQIYEVAYMEAQHFILRKFNATLETKDIYFIDDIPANVKAAKSMGWNASLVNLLSDDILKKVLSQTIKDEELRQVSKKRENLVFGLAASQRVEKIFGNIIEL